MEVDNTSSEFGVDEQEKFLQMNLSFILQSEIGSRLQSPQDSDVDVDDMVLREEDIDDGDEEDSFEIEDQYECDSQCNEPCTNKKHVENKNFVNIIEKALRDHKFDTDSVESQKFYEQIFQNPSHKPIFMRQSP